MDLHYLAAFGLRYALCLFALGFALPGDGAAAAIVVALVRAGITTGCDDSPDGVVTREQMAAFLARALGLHGAP